MGYLINVFYCPHSLPNKQFFLVRSRELMQPWAKYWSMKRVESRLTPKNGGMISRKFLTIALQSSMLPTDWQKSPFVADCSRKPTGY